MDLKNTFEKGMWRDNDPNVQPQGTYYESRCGKLINLGDGNYAWETLMGNTFSFGSATVLTGGTFVTVADDLILGFCMMRNNGVVFIYNTGTHACNIIELIFSETGFVTTAYLKYTGAIGWNTYSRIESFGYYESENIRRVYWTDNSVNPMSLNLFLITDVNLQNAPHSITVDQLAQAPQTFFAIPVFDYLSTGGNLNNGTYFFTYQLYSNNSGAQTDWSPLSLAMRTQTKIGIGDMDTYQLVQGENITTGTTLSINFTIDDINTLFQYIKIAVFRSTDYDVVEVGKIVFDELITSSSMTFKYIGQAASGILTIDEAASSTITLVKVKTIDHIKKRMDNANITEESEIDSDLGTVTATPYLYELPSDYRDLPTDTITSRPDFRSLIGHQSFDWTTGISDAPIGPETYGYIYPEQWYKVVGTVGTDYVEYPMGSGQFYNNVGTPTIFKGMGLSGDIITYGEFNCRTFGKINNPIVKPILHVPKYCDVAGNYVYSDYDEHDCFLDFKSEVVDSVMKGYWGEETYRYGLRPISLTGKKWGVKWLCDKTLPSRDGIASSYPMVKGYFPRTAHNPAKPDYLSCYNITTMGVRLGSIDLSDYIYYNPITHTSTPLISGFEIVRAERIKNIIAEGVLQCCYYDAGPNVHPQLQWGGQPETLTNKTYYFFYSPEFLFGRYHPEFNTGEKIKIVTYYTSLDCKSYNPDNEDTLTQYERVFASGFRPYYYKFYKEEDLSGTDYWPYTTFNIVNRFPVDFDLSTPINAIPIPNSSDHVVNAGVFRNESTHTPTVYGRSAPTEFIQLDATSTAAGVIGHQHIALGQDNRMVYCQIEKGIAPGSFYGSKYDTEYISTGWFLELDSTIAATLHVSGSTYRIDNVTVFGGDTYVNFFDILKNYIDRKDDPFGFGETIMFPCQSTVNVALRQGLHPAKNRQTNGPVAPLPIWDGMYVDTITPTNNKLEDFNYNDSFSTEKVVVDVAQPEDYNQISKYDIRHRYTEEKLNGQKIDTFRIYKANNFIDVDSKFGPVNNIKAKHDRLFYWQDDCFGYIPVMEQEYITSSAGNPMVLGTGTVFQRYNHLKEMIGNQNQWGLVDIIDGFFWTDIKRKTFIRSNAMGELTDESFPKGMKNFLLFDPLIFALAGDLFTDIVYNQALSSMYATFDPWNKHVVIIFKGTFIQQVITEVLLFDTVQNCWIDRQSNYVNGAIQANYFSRYLFNNNKYLFGTDPVTIGTTEKNVYVFNPYLSKYAQFYTYTNPSESWIEFIVNQDYDTEKVFDNIKLLCENLLPTRIEYYDSNTLPTSTPTMIDYITTGTTTPPVIVNRNYELRNRKLKGSIPLSGRKRIRGDGWMRIRIVCDNRRISGQSLSNTYNKFRLLDCVTRARQTY